MMRRLRYASVVAVLLGFGTLLSIFAVKGCPPKDGLVIPVSGIAAPVTVYRDEWGIPHIYGENRADVAFAQGYVQASDRFFQMELLRSSANGTLSRLLGPGGDDEIFRYDWEQRRLGFRRVAERIARQLREDAANGDEAKARFLDVLEHFAAGVNAYIDGIYAGRNDLPPAYRYLLGGRLEAGDILPWTIEDTLSFGRLQSFELSYSGGDDIGLTARMESYLTAFGVPGAPGLIPGREGLFFDLFTMEPIVKASTLYAFDSPPQRQGGRPFPTTPLPIHDPRLRRELGKFKSRRSGEAGHHGSNNWVISGALTRSGFPILANDPHLSLDMPPIFYLVHLNTKDAGGEENVMGVTFAASPGVVIGFNESIAWGVTTFDPDVTDVYLEEITHGPDGDTVAFDDPFDDPDQGVQQVPIETIVEPIEVRDPESGEITTRDVEIRIVPHHGPLIAEGESEGVSVRWTGFEPSEEVRAFFEINAARDLDSFKTALSLFEVGAQNFVYADTARNIYYSGHAYIPKRAPAALTPETPPYLILPGQGGHEWVGRLSPEEIPHLENPVRGYIATANNSADGGNFDDDPLNDPVYLGTYFDLGCREGRITELLEAARRQERKLTIEDVAAIQGDTFSCTGFRLVPFILEAVERTGPLGDPELEAAVARLADWNFETPAAVSVDPSRRESNDPEVRAASVATTIFNLWQNAFLHRTIDDEIAALNAALPDRQVGFISSSASAPGYRGIYKILVDPAGTNVGDRIFDNLATEEIVETRYDIIVLALRDAVARGTEIFGTADQNEWLWGKLHTITFEDLSGIPQYNVPPGEETDESGFPTGYPRPGDKFAVDASEFSFSAGLGEVPDSRDDFTYGSGPSMRFVVEMIPGHVRAVNILPGGESADLLDPHYDDQADRWVRNETAPMHFYTEDVLRYQRARILFEPIE